MKKNQLKSLIREVLEESSLKSDLQFIMRHLGLAEAHAARSYREKKRNPDQDTIEEFTTEVLVDMLKDIYNSFLTGDAKNKTYEDEVFK